jgi:hypothetical protein
MRHQPAGMKDFSPIEPIVQRICDTAVEALARFYELTEFPPDWMHESFMASYVFERLGEETSMMPEVMVSTLWGWNKTEGSRPPPPLPPELRGQQRTDLVLFAPQKVPRDEQGIWCLIEFKRDSRVDGDINKIKSLLPFFDGCDFGAACGVVDLKKYHSGWLDEERVQTEERGERFVTSTPWEVAIEGRQRSFVVCAWVFTARAANTPLPWR